MHLYFIMWQVLANDTSFWTCFWFLFGATMQMNFTQWEVVSAAYIYSSFEFILGSAVNEVQDPVLTWFAYKVAVVIGITFGTVIQRNGSPWLMLALLPGITLYAHDHAKFGVAALYVGACIILRYYTWALYCTCVTLTCLLLPMQIQGAPLIAMCAPVVFGFIYAAKYDAVPETTYSDCPA